MTAFDWFAGIIVIIAFMYLNLLNFIEWVVALRKGQAVPLLPEGNSRKWPTWIQVTVNILSIAIFIVIVYFLWIPLIKIPAGIARIFGIIGLLVYITGMVFLFWARNALGKYWGLSSSRQVKLLDDHQLIQSGPYAFVRNPMYFGWWVAVLGLLMLYPTWIMLILFIYSIITFTGRAKHEDVALSERFGMQWTEYKKRTRFFIPFIY